MSEKPLHKENIELLFHVSKAAKLLLKPLGELTPEEKEEWSKSVESYRIDIGDSG